MLRIPLAALLFCAAVPFLHGAISVSNVADKTKYDAPRSFTVNADPNAAVTTATLDGVPVPVGTAVPVTGIGFHELRAESRDAGGALVDSLYVRFITRNPARGGSEDGIPTFTPWNSVNDAPSAFAGGVLKVVAPSAWPTGHPVPVAARLLTAGGETLRLNGLVAMGGFPGTTLRLRRGWGSVTAPAVAAPGNVQVKAFVNGLADNPEIAVQDMTFTDVSGTISSDTTWPAHSRMRVTSRLTVAAGTTLTIGEGTIVLMGTGTATNGTGVEISVGGTLACNGTEANPVVFAPATPGANWGGIELPAATSMVSANWTIFTGAGEDDDWFGNNPGLGGSTHQSEQPVFAIVGSGSGTAIGARLHLNDCFSFDHAGQQMNSKTNTWIDLQRTLMQRCITCGELNGSKVTIDRSALIEFPSETGEFVDDDNDAIYLTSGDLSITNTVIGFTKDDGVDSGGSGGASPFGTVDPATGTTTTRYDSTGNWYEGTYHEGNSLSGTRNVYFSGCVFLNCGQGVEAGYSNSPTSDGPHAVIDGCLFAGNMVGVRVGDNYGSGYSYNSTADVKNSLILNSGFHDVWSYNWHPTNANAWIYLDATTTNSQGKPWFKVENNLLSKPDAVHHPANTQWNAANPAHAALIEPFMPVPGSNVGVAVSSYAPSQQATADYTASHAVRLSTFSSKPVSVDWAVVAKVDAFADAGAVLASGTLDFAPGETVKTITAPVATPGDYGLIHVALSGAVNAEVTGEKVYVELPDPVPPPVYASYGSGGNGSAGSGTPGSVWRYKTDLTTATIGGIPANWKDSGFDDSSWAAGPAQIGFGDNDENTPVARTDYDPGTSGTQSGPSYLFRSTFNVPDKSQLATVTGQVKYDDGAVVYVNGTEVLRTSNIAPGAALTDYAIFNNAAARENATAELAIPLPLLNDGPNTIAVEIHNRDADSSDMTFDLRLSATLLDNTPLDLNFAESNGSPVLWWFGQGDVLEHSTDLLIWLPFPAAGSPVIVTPVLPREFFRLRRP